jgi:hypothetical protein
MRAVTSGCDNGRRNQLRSAVVECPADELRALEQSDPVPANGCVQRPTTAVGQRLRSADNGYAHQSADNGCARRTTGAALGGRRPTAALDG